MSQYIVDRGFAALSLITALLLCDCSSPNLAIESNPMPEKQVATYMTSVTPSSAYDTPPKFLKGYVPFFPATEAQRRHWGYAVVEFSVTADGATSDIRAITATAYSFAEEAMYAVQNWRFAPARKHGQPVVVRCDSRLPSEVECEMDRQSAQDKFLNCRFSIEGDQHLPSLRHPAERIIWLL
jgi:TonB family protein